MPVPRHIRMTALGRLGSSGERFSYGLNFATTLNGTVARFFGIDPGDSLFADLAADTRAFHIRSDTALAPAAILETVKFASIGEDGKYDTDPVTIDVVDAPGGKTDFPQSGMVLPQAACVVSLTSARRGPTGKGRVFLPMPNVQLDNTLRMTPNFQGAIQASAAAWLVACKNEPGFDLNGLRPVIISSKGYSSEVKGVRVGRVLDTMRSRRTSIPEDYSAPTGI